MSDLSRVVKASAAKLGITIEEIMQKVGMTKCMFYRRMKDPYLLTIGELERLAIVTKLSVEDLYKVIKTS